MRWRVVLVALAAVTAGCSALGGTGQTTTLTPAPVPSDVPASGPGSTFAPGVGADGDVDPARLADAHRTALANRSFRWLATRNWTGTVGNVTTVSNSHHLVVFENATRYYRDTDRVLDHWSEAIYSRYSEYANGSHQFVRATAFNRPGTEYGRSTASPATYRLTRQTALPIRRYLRVETASVERVRVDGHRRVRIVGHGAGEGWSGTVRNYTVRALVTPEGIVTNLSAHYQLVRGASVETVDYQFRFQQLGAVTVSPPAWLPDARRRLANGSAGFPEL